jgi:hypothetical protein
VTPFGAVICRSPKRRQRFSQITSYITPRKLYSLTHSLSLITLPSLPLPPILLRGSPSPGGTTFSSPHQIPPNKSSTGECLRVANRRRGGDGGMGPMRPAIHWVHAVLIFHTAKKLLFRFRGALSRYTLFFHLRVTDLDFYCVCIKKSDKMETFTISSL